MVKKHSTVFLELRLVLLSFYTGKNGELPLGHALKRQQLRTEDLRKVMTS
jgi:hypothetical protein